MLNINLLNTPGKQVKGVDDRIFSSNVIKKNTISGKKEIVIKADKRKTNNSNFKFELLLVLIIVIAIGYYLLIL